MSGSLYAIYGARGHGRDALIMAEAEIARSAGARLVFIDDAPEGAQFSPYPVMTWREFLDQPAAGRRVAIALAGAEARRKLAARLAETGIPAWTLIAPNALVSPHASIGEGALIGPGSIVSANARLGDFVQVNSQCNLAHDLVAGDFVTFGPGALVNGVVEIGEGAYIGAGAMIRQGEPGRPLRIGAGAFVGMGAVVTRDVPAGETWIGNPARRKPESRAKQT